MASSPLLFVPKKQTSDIDFSGYMRPIIQKLYQESPAAFVDQISALNRARQDALRGTAGSEATARDLLLKYFGMLELLELRFSELRVPFPWTDAFTTISISQSSLAYEKASVIFNIGSTLSSLASTSPRTSPEALKRTFNSLRQAMGMFIYINDNFLHAPSTDLSRELVKVLITIMEAQATEIFLETMPPLGDNSKGAALKAKVANTASNLYLSIVEEAKEWVTKGVFVKEWSNLIQVKAKYFASLAQYYKSLADAATSKYGDSLARLHLALSLAKEAQKLCVSFSSSYLPVNTLTSLPVDAPTSMLELTKNHLALIEEVLKLAEKDNDLIYHASMTSTPALPAIDKLTVAAPIAIGDVYATDEVQRLVGPDLFSKLIPIAVIEGSSVYDEMKASLVRGEAEKCELAEGERVAALDYMGLPAALEKFKHAGAGLDGLADPGKDVRAWAEEIRAGEHSREGRTAELLQRLDTIKASTMNTLVKTPQLLEHESFECEAKRTQFGPLFDQQPSTNFTRSFRADLRSHKESLEQASRSDEQLGQLWESIKADIAILVSGGDAIERLFVEAIASENGTKKEVSLLDDGDLQDDQRATAETEDLRKRVEKLQDGLSRLHAVKRERLEVLKDLKERIQTDDISRLLIVNRKGPAPIDQALFNTELEKFRPHQSRIGATIQHQSALLSAITADFKALSEGPSGRAISLKWARGEKSRKLVLERLARAHSGNAEVREGARKGLEYYTGLEELVDGLLVQISDFVTSRNEERTRLVNTAEVRQRMSSSQGSPAPSLDRSLGQMDLNQRPPPPSNQPSWSSQAPSSSSYSSPPPARSPYSPPPIQQQQQQQPYGGMPTTGAFANTAPLAQPAYNSAARSPAPTNAPPPRLPQNPYATSSPYPAQSYGQPSPYASSPSPLPPPPAPAAYSSYSSLPPPPRQQSYSSQPSYGAPPPVPSPSYYGAPPPQQQQQQQGQQGQPQQYATPPAQYGQYQAPPAGNPYAPPPQQQQYGHPPAPQQQQQQQYDQQYQRQ